MAADWDEVKRLAADFQRAQLSSTVQRLSERNCIEIVKKLIELKLVDVIFTSDGKEYVTPRHLLKEIEDELIVHGGRVNLVDLSRILGLDFSHIEVKAHELARSEANLRIVLGQLIDDNYLDNVAEEINDKLQQIGQITIGELTKQYDLPGDFLEETVHKRLGTSIQGQADPFDARTIFTEAYIARYKAIIRGLLSAVTRPTSISTLISSYKIPERLFYSILEELIKTQRLSGSISGGRSERASYIPDIYAKSQNEWVDSFYKQNGYLEYGSLVRLGISEPKAYLSKKFIKDTLTYLNSCCIGKSILEQAEAAIDEAVTTSSWADITPLLPSLLTVEDIQQIIHTILKHNTNYSNNCQIFCDTLVVSKAFIQDCCNMFDQPMATKAEEDAQKGAHFFVTSQQRPSTKVEKLDEHGGRGKHDKKEEKRKKGSKAGGGAGTQGRETKIRSTKKKYRAGKEDEESDSEGEEGAFSGSRGGKKQPELEFLSPDEIEKHLSEMITMQECPDELITELAKHLHRPLTKKYQELAKSVFLASTAASSSFRRKTHAETQEKLNTMACQVHMFEKGAKLFAEDVQPHLIKYLLKTLCTEMTNMILNYLCTEHGIHTDGEITSAITPEARLKIITKLPSELKDGVMKLHSSLNGKTLEDFFQGLDVVMGPDICDMMMKKIDKKRERQAVFEYRHTLLNQLTEATDSALCLHLAVLIFILAQTQQMLHASGKFVPQMISFLQKQAPVHIYQLLHEYQDLVMRQLNLQLDEAEKSSVISQLEELKPKLKEVATTYKKTLQTSDET